MEDDKCCHSVLLFVFCYSNVFGTTFLHTIIINQWSFNLYRIIYFVFVFTRKHEFSTTSTVHFNLLIQSKKYNRSQITRNNLLMRQTINQRIMHFLSCYYRHIYEASIPIPALCIGIIVFLTFSIPSIIAQSGPQQSKRKNNTK